MNMLDAIGGRKVLVFGGVLILSLALVLIKGDVPPGFISILQWVIPAFVLGNGIEHVASAYSASNSSAVQDTVVATQGVSSDAVAALQASMNELKAQNEALASQDQQLAQGMVQLLTAVNTSNQLLAKATSRG